jgi:integrative and conjugative element protein (TIGR02256 family)
MSWFYRHPEWLASETRELSSSSVYKEKLQVINRLLVSFGRIVIRNNKIETWPILIVYPEATPYRAPKIYILKCELDYQSIVVLSQSKFTDLHDHLNNKVEYVYKRHQNADGSVCFLETSDLHSERAEAVCIREILSRLCSWLGGKPQPDSREVELFHHFPNTTSELHFLLTDIFLKEGAVRGTFFAQKISLFTSILDVDKAYLGICISGETEAGVSLAPVYLNSMFSEILPHPVNLLDEGDAKTLKDLDTGILIKGFWWDIDEEIQPFHGVKQFMELIGHGSEDEGVSTFLGGGFLKAYVKKQQQQIYLGTRFPGRMQSHDWQMFRLVRKSPIEYLPNVTWDFNDYKQCLLQNYTIEAVRHEYFTEEYYHRRNSGRVERGLLKSKKISFLGCGAIGSEVADCICKAGVGAAMLVDPKLMRPHNPIRHVLGLGTTGTPKSIGLWMDLSLHNPFVSIKPLVVDIFDNDINEYVPDDFVGFSSMADDNTEAYLNEQAIALGKTIFYCRALRGGKTGRIFRVIPHEDACKNCLTIYFTRGSSLFPRIEEDPELPEITNECNDPVRPASAADLKVLAGIASKLLLDWLQGKDKDNNHWVWTTDSLDTIQLDVAEYGRVQSYNIPPHPECPVCQELSLKEIYVQKSAYEFMKAESKSSDDIETGGVLVGQYSPPGKYVIHKATGPGPKAIRTSTLFRRDVEYCQGEIDRAAEVWGLKGQYVGEWHYHTSNSNSPSGTDIKSLKEIAGDEKYLIDHPIMIIFSNASECAITIHDRTGRCVKLPVNVFDDNLSEFQ